MTQSYELHFQEGFTGEAIEIRLDGKLVKTIKPKTRMQTGLAQIETIDAAPGQKVAVRAEESGESAELTLRKGQQFVNIARLAAGLVIESADVSPGYL